MKISKYSIFLVVFFMLCVTVRAADFYKEVNILSGYSHDRGWVGEQRGGLKNSLGFEYYKKFSSDYGDFLTVDLQARLAYDSAQRLGDAVNIEIHNAWLEYKLGLGKNIRIGHFDPSFGLEPILDTHGTLFQTLMRQNIGFKKDWGISYRAVTENMDYEVSAQLGSGMGIGRKDGSFLLSARAGTPQTGELQGGVSLLYGEVLTTHSMHTIPSVSYSDSTVRKKRIGFDAQYLRGSYLFRGEVAFGQDDDAEVFGVHLETVYTLPKHQDFQFTLQGQVWDNDLHEQGTIDAMLGVGVSYALSSASTIRLAYFHDIQSSDRREDRQVLLQYYFFGS